MKTRILLVVTARYSRSRVAPSPRDEAVTSISLKAKALQLRYDGHGGCLMDGSVDFFYSTASEANASRFIAHVLRVTADYRVRRLVTVRRYREED